MTIKAWCVHPDLIPREIIVFAPEPEEVYVRGPSLFLNLEDIDHHSRPTQRYRVLMGILEVVDWHSQPDSSSDDDDHGPDGGGDGSYQKCFIRQSR
jgi:hypothetical protein